MIDYAVLMLDPIYMTLGVPAAITLADGTTIVTGLTVIDKTTGVQTGDNAAKVDTVEPAACIRLYEWEGVGRRLQDFEGAQIVFNGSRWDIAAYPKRPVPAGAKRGEVLLILENESEVGESSS